MDSNRRKKILCFMTQRSTIVGIVAMTVPLVGIIGFDMTAEHQLKLVEGLLIISSIVLVATKEDPKGGVNRDDNRNGGNGPQRTNGDADLRETQKQEAGQEAGRPS